MKSYNLINTLLLQYIILYILHILYTFIVHIWKQDPIIHNSTSLCYYVFIILTFLNKSSWNSIPVGSPDSTTLCFLTWLNQGLYSTLHHWTCTNYSPFLMTFLPSCCAGVCMCVSEDTLYIFWMLVSDSSASCIHKLLFEVKILEADWRQPSP